MWLWIGAILCFIAYKYDPHKHKVIAMILWIGAILCFIAYRYDPL